MPLSEVNLYHGTINITEELDQTSDPIRGQALSTAVAGVRDLGHMVISNGTV